MNYILKYYYIINYKYIHIMYHKYLRISLINERTDFLCYVARPSRMQRPIPICKVLILPSLFLAKTSDSYAVQLFVVAYLIHRYFNAW